MKPTHGAIISLILGSAMLVGPSCFANQAKSRPGQKSAHASGAVAWTQYEDPLEHAFTLDVPRGWTVKGGMFRLGYSDARPMVDMHSPDGKIAIRLGDLSVPVYAAPTPPYHTREGEVYDLGAQGQLIVAKYHTGPEFAALYAQARFSGVCGNPQPDASAPQFVPPSSMPEDADVKESSTGQITYRCDSNGQPRIAFTYVKTANYGPIWAVPDLVSYIVTPEDVATARDIVSHCAQSFKISPRWLEYKKQMDAEGMEYQRERQMGRMRQLQQQQMQFEAQMQAMKNQANAFEHHMDQERSQFEKMDDAINGVTPTTDPLTGEFRKVWTGTQNNYWVNGLGQVVNSNSNPNPAGNWHQLQVGSQ
ncbi:MAG TPA: hypothetical protein VMF66_19810 [Candidatus Acidoferrum sp.]|nr:hypothetical protein [Candidatus Acidoferrum sp.]